MCCHAHAPHDLPFIDDEDVVELKFSEDGSCRQSDRGGRTDFEANMGEHASADFRAGVIFKRVAVERDNDGVALAAVPWRATNSGNQAIKIVIAEGINTDSDLVTGFDYADLPISD